MRVHSNPGDKLLDFSAGSGTFGEVAYLKNRNFALIDKSDESVEVMKRRLTDAIKVANS